MHNFEKKLESGERLYIDIDYQPNSASLSTTIHACDAKGREDQEWGPELKALYQKAIDSLKDAGFTFSNKERLILGKANDFAYMRLQSFEHKSYNDEAMVEGAAVAALKSAGLDSPEIAYSTKITDRTPPARLIPDKNDRAALIEKVKRKIDAVHGVNKEHLALSAELVDVVKKHFGIETERGKH